MNVKLEPGVIEFEEPITLVKESVGKAEIKLVRVNGADGRVSVHYRTKDIDAVATKDYERRINSFERDKHPIFCLNSFAK